MKDHLPAHRTLSSFRAAQPLFIHGDCRVDLDPARLHCFRHLSGEVELKQAVLEGCVFNLDVIGEVSESILNHSKKDMDKVYNNANYLRQKLAALTKWEDHVMKIVGSTAIAAGSV